MRLLAILVFALGNLPPRAHPCGSERLNVKTLDDDEADKVDFEHPVVITIQAARALPAPDWSEGLVRTNAERRLYRFDADLIAYKHEPGDQDFHLAVIAPGTPCMSRVQLRAGECVSMIIESVAPRCAAGSLVAGDVSDVRDALDEILPSPPTSAYRYLDHPIPLTVEGVGFFDRIHGQLGATPNGFELHPITSVAMRGGRAKPKGP